MRENVFDRWDEDGFANQGVSQGIKSLAFQYKNPNKVADELGLHKDGRSRRGVPPCCRPVDNSKRNGLKGIPKRLKRKSIRLIKIQQS